MVREFILKLKTNIKVEIDGDIKTTLWHVFNLKIIIKSEDLDQDIVIQFNVDGMDYNNKMCNITPDTLTKRGFGNPRIMDFYTENNKMCFAAGRYNDIFDEIMILKLPMYVKDMIEEKLQEICEYWKNQGYQMSYSLDI